MRNLVRFMAVFCCGCIALQASPASAEKKVALVVGNATYGHQARLPNVPSDAAAIAGLLRVAGFDVVDARHNLGVAELRRALRDFSGRAADADVAVFFYAGHGIEVGQTNYLVPVDARLVTDFDVEDEAVPVERVLQAMERARRLRLVILDACRDNPFTKSIKRTTAGRSVGRGLGRLEPATTDTLIAYATKPNAIAEDGAGPNSPFTAALLKHLLAPGVDVRLALGRVRDEVLAVTARRQEPYVTGSLGGTTVSLAAPLPVETSTSKVAPPQAVVPAHAAAETAARICREVEAMSNPATLAVLERQHKGTPAGECVAARMAQLKTAAVAPPPPPVTAPTMAGQWYGVLTQVPAGSAGSTYPVDITLSAANGTIGYPTLGCGGSLIRLSGDETRTVFREVLSYGRDRCIDNGHIALQLVGDRLSYAWSGLHVGRDVKATGTLKRKGR